MKRNVFILAAAAVSACLLFTSCKKKEVEDNDTEGVKDHAFAETSSNDVVNIGIQASYNNLSTYKLANTNTDLSTCAVITFDTLNHLDPDTLDVDFGATGCTPLYGRARKGLIRYIYTAGKHYRDSACVINVSTPGNTYYVDNNQVMINSKTITNMGHVGSFLTWNVTASITVNRSNGGHFSWNSNKTKVLIAGEMPNNQPINWPGAKIGVYGSANGTTAKGESFSVNVSQANMLVRDFTCGSFRRFFVKGILEFTPGNKPTRYINFGTGNCDDAAVVTINGHSYNVTLH